MALQFNFFAVDKDEVIIRETLVSILGKIFVMADKGRKEDLKPQRVFHADDLSAEKIQKSLCIIPEEALNRLELRDIPNNLYRIDFRAFPCLEYTPSKLVSQNTVAVGRIAYFSETNSPFCTKVVKLLGQLKKKSRKIKGKSGFWIFDDTARNAASLKYWVGSAQNNPMGKETNKGPEEAPG